MKHKIISYDKAALYVNPQDVISLADSDEELKAKLDELRSKGHGIRGWLETAESKDVQRSGRKGKEGN
jgi:hypothetical protein